MSVANFIIRKENRAEKITFCHEMMEQDAAKPEIETQ
jgi:hypothetical protein